MKNSKIMQWGGITAVFGGLIWMGFYIWYITADVSEGKLWVIIPAKLFLAMTLLALTKSKRAGSSRLGLYIGIVGLGLMTIGLFGVSLLRIGYAWLFGILGEITLSVGLILFGITNIQERLLPRFNTLPLVLLFIYAPSWMIDPGNLPTILLRNFTEWLAMLAGALWMLLGVLMLVSDRETAVTMDTVRRN